MEVLLDKLATLFMILPKAERVAPEMSYRVHRLVRLFSTVQSTGGRIVYSPRIFERLRLELIGAHKNLGSVFAEYERHITSGRFVIAAFDRYLANYEDLREDERDRLRYLVNLVSAISVSESPRNTHEAYFALKETILKAFAPKRLEDFEEKLEFLDEPPICAYQEISPTSCPTSDLVKAYANSPHFREVCQRFVPFFEELDRRKLYPIWRGMLHRMKEGRPPPQPPSHPTDPSDRIEWYQSIIDTMEDTYRNLDLVLEGDRLWLWDAIHTFVSSVNLVDSLEKTGGQEEQKRCLCLCDPWITMALVGVPKSDAGEFSKVDAAFSFDERLWLTFPGTLFSLDCGHEEIPSVDRRLEWREYYRNGQKWQSVVEFSQEDTHSRVWLEVTESSRPLFYGFRSKYAIPNLVPYGDTVKVEKNPHPVTFVPAGPHDERHGQGYRCMDDIYRDRDPLRNLATVSPWR